MRSTRCHIFNYRGAFQYLPAFVNSTRFTRLTRCQYGLCVSFSFFERIILQFPEINRPCKGPITVTEKGNVWSGGKLTFDALPFLCYDWVITETKALTVQLLIAVTDRQEDGIGQLSLDFLSFLLGLTRIIRE